MFYFVPLAEEAEPVLERPRVRCPRGVVLSLQSLYPQSLLRLNNFGLELRLAGAWGWFSERKDHYQRRSKALTRMRSCVHGPGC
jgi:hypothetical protein